MAKYRVETLDRAVRRQLDRIREPDLGRIAVAIHALEDNPRPWGSVKLRGIDGWRIRIGDWRVIYHIDDRDYLVTIVAIKRRAEHTYI